MKRLEVNSRLISNKNYCYLNFETHYYKENEKAEYIYNRKFGKRQFILIHKLHYLIDNRITKW